MTRRGMSFLEVVVAGVMLAALTTVCLEMLGATAVQRRTLQQRQAAMRQAANAMERLAARSFNTLTPQGVADVKLSESALRQLPGGTLVIEIIHPAGDPEAKRITVSVRWRDASGEPAGHAQLVCWRYP